MTTVWKYPLKIVDRQVLEIPHPSSGSKILHVDVIDNEIFLWVEVNPENPPVQTTILCFGTGHPLLWSDLEHIGTVIKESGVWHFYMPAADLRI